MIRLSTLGSVSVRNTTGELASSLISQPKRLALFAYIAVTSAESPLISRDRLCGMFWPDSDPDRANQALSQALLHIRRSLGEDAVKGKGQAAFSIDESVQCDAVDFIRACRAMDHEKALALYSGPFLLAFSPAASPDFEEWADNQRTRFRSMAAQSARALRDRAIAAGSAAEAARWAQRVVDLCDVSDADSAKLIELLVAIGDRAGAKRAYQDLTERLREDYDLEPTGGTSALIANLADPTVATEVARLPKFAAPIVVATPPDKSLMPRSPRYSGILVTAGSAALAIVFYGMWGMHSRTASSSVVTSPVITIESVSSGTEDAALGARLTTELVEKLRVDDRLLTRTAIGAGDVNGATDYVLRTTIVNVDDKLTAAATLFNARTGITLHQVEVDASTPSDSVARAIVVSMRQALGRDLEHAALKRRIKNPRAWSLVNAAYIQRVEADSLRSHGAFKAAELALLQADSLLSAVPHSSSNDTDVLLAHAGVAKELMWVQFMSGRGSSPETRRTMVRGMAYAESAVEKEPLNARALEAAGLFSHFLTITTPPDSVAARAAILEVSLRYLNAAVKADPGRARAWSLMSVLLIKKNDYQHAYWAAKQGRNADVFKEYAADLDVRMFDAALQVGDLTAARLACDDFRKDVGNGYFSATCQLQLLAWMPERTRGGDALINRVLNAAAQTAMPSEKAQLRMLAATYYARHGQPDRARAFAVNSAATNATDDVALLRITAWYDTSCGDFANARLLLDRIAQLSPDLAVEYAASAEFAPLKVGTKRYGVQ